MRAWSAHIAPRHRANSYERIYALYIYGLATLRRNGLDVRYKTVLTPSPRRHAKCRYRTTSSAAMIAFTSLLSLLLATSTSAQQIGDYVKEVHPPLPIQSCTAPNSCTNLSTSLTVDENWRWLHNKDNYQNCYDGNWWNVTLCPDNRSCAANCAIDGAEYKSIYGVTTTPAGALNMKHLTRHDFSYNIGSRIYLMASETKYHMFKLLNKEFSFEVDISTLPCGANAALYFVEMDEDGGMSKYPSNKAGARYGTGYCSAKCPRELRFINGEVRDSTLLWRTETLWRASHANLHQGKCRRMATQRTRPNCRNRQIWLLLRRSRHMGSKLHLDSHDTSLVLHQRPCSLRRRRLS